ncbi:MAG: response regulator [Armatimonadetes bacterium]|nr:response regulator [Armatimonadota bacterium]
MAHKILVVDGDRDVRDLIVSGLVGEGYEVPAAADGEQGLALARAERPDLICLEVALPKLDGFQLASRLRSDPTLQSIPFIFLTGRHGLKDRVEGLRLGAHAYMAKPFAFPELFAAVSGILQRLPASDAPPGSTALPASTGLGLMGSLGAISLAAVIQAIEGEMQTGVLRIVSGIKWGQLAFHRGKIISATAGSLTAEDAVVELVGWDTGTYAFRTEAVEARPPLAESATSVLMRALQHHDERRAALQA